MKNIPVTEVMTKNIVTISNKSSLDEAERLMRKNHIRHLPVVKGGKLVGIISLTDILRLSFGDTYQDDEEVDVAVFNMLTLESVMVNRPTTITTTQTVMEAAEILAEKEFHALPVTEGEKVVGIVTTTDLIKFFVKHYK
jgi:CBS domain-containing membrane protein